MFSQSSGLRLSSTERSYQFRDREIHHVHTWSPQAVTGCSFVAHKGIDDAGGEYYRIVVTQQRGPQLLADFSQYRPDKRNATFIIQSKLQNGTRIVLPKHMRCYVYQPDDKEYDLSEQRYEFCDARLRVLTNSKKRTASELALSPVALAASSESSRLEPYSKQARISPPESFIIQALEKALTGYPATWPYPVAPRDYQVEILKEYLTALKDGHKKTVFPLATGSGKTFLFSMLAAMTQKTVLILVHRDNLLSQTKAQFQRFVPGEKIGLLKTATELNFTEYAGSKIIENCRVVIGTYQWLKLNKNKIDFSKIGMLLLDEAHQCLSKQSVELVATAEENECYINAFSATPWVGVKKDMNAGVETVYQLLGFKADGSNNPITGIDLKHAIEIGANCPIAVTYIKPKLRQALKFSRKSNDISQNEVSDQINHKELNNTLVDAYMNGREPQTQIRYLGQKTIVFCCGIQHSDGIEAAFNALDIDLVDSHELFRNAYADKMVAKYIEQKERQLQQRERLTNVSFRPSPAAIETVRNEAKKQFKIALAVHSKLDKKTNDQRMEQHSLGGALLLIGADKIMEGYDDPEVSIVILARPTQSDKVMLQAMGRGTRINPDDPDKYCSIIQFVYQDESDLRVKLAHQYVNDEYSTEYEYGKNIKTYRENKILQHQNDHHDIIPIPEKLDYETLNSIEQKDRHSKTTQKKEKNKQHKKTAEEIHQKKQRTIEEKEKAIVTQLKKLCDSIDRLHELFYEIKEREQSDSPAAATLGNGLFKNKKEIKDITKLKRLNQPEELSYTREVFASIIKAKKRLLTIKGYLTTSIRRLKSNKTSNFLNLKSTNDEINELLSLTDGLITEIDGYLQLDLSGKAIDESDDELDNIIAKFEAIQMRLDNLNERIEADKDNIHLDNSNQDKQPPEKEKENNKDKDIGLNDEATRELVIAEWYKLHPGATLHTWYKDISKLGVYRSNSLAAKIADKVYPSHDFQNPIKVLKILLGHYMSNLDIRHCDEAEKVLCLLFNDTNAHHQSSNKYKPYFLKAFLEYYSECFHENVFSTGTILHLMVTVPMTQFHLEFLVRLVLDHQFNVNVLNQNEEPCLTAANSLLFQNHNDLKNRQLFFMILSHFGYDFSNPNLDSLLRHHHLKLDDNQKISGNMFLSMVNRINGIPAASFFNKIIRQIYDERTLGEKVKANPQALLTHISPAFYKIHFLLELFLKVNDSDFYQTHYLKGDSRLGTILHFIFDSFSKNPNHLPSHNRAVSHGNSSHEHLATLLSRSLSSINDTSYFNGRTCLEHLISESYHFSMLKLFVEFFLPYPEAFLVKNQKDGISILEVLIQRLNNLTADFRKPEELDAMKADFIKAVKESSLSQYDQLQLELAIQSIASKDDSKTQPIDRDVAMPEARQSNAQPQASATNLPGFFASPEPQYFTDEMIDNLLQGEGEEGLDQLLLSLS